MAIKRKIQKVSPQAEKIVSFAEAFEEFLTEKTASNLSPSSIRNYTQSLEYFMEFHELTEEDDIHQVTKQHFFKWINTQHLEGKKHSTINHYLRDCRTFFYWCMDSDRGYIEPFKIQLTTAQEEQLKLFSDSDIEKRLEKPRAKDSFTEWRMWAVVNWVLATGNRAATICDVKISDVDFKTKEIKLQHTKNKKAQIIPLSPSLATVLKQYLKMWRKDADEDTFLFCNVGEEQLTTNALRHNFQKYCADREVEQTNIHGLRHNFAKGWIRNGGDVFKLQRILGHSSLEMTRRYVKLFSEDIKEDFEEFSPLDNIKKKNQNRLTKIKRSE